MQHKPIQTRWWTLVLVALFLAALTAGCAKKPIPVQSTPPAPSKASAQESATNPQNTNPGQLGVENLNAEQVQEAASNSTNANETSTTSMNATSQPALTIHISEGRTDAPMLPIYFDFDKYNIRPDMISRMQNNAKFLLAHPSVKIQIQGNCDERGSVSYNLALGQKRAESAKKYLVNLGISPDRISVISFGKEKPLDPRHCPAAWAKNRRDDFVITSK